MSSLVNTNFNRTYNPAGRQNALSDIKRLLNSRDNVAQNKACGFLLEVINKYHPNSTERIRMVEYLLDNDITVFLCEATSNLEFSLLRSILSCFRLLWREHRFFSEEHAAHSMAAVLRALALYANSGLYAAVDCCLHYLCDLLSGVSVHQVTAPLSQQSAYSAEQLLACFLDLAPKINNRKNSILSGALVLHALISYQPNGLRIRGVTVTALVEVLGQWFVLLVGALNHSNLVDDEENVAGMFYAVTCQLGLDVLRLIEVIREDKRTDFVQSILIDEHELALLMEGTLQMMNAVYSVIVVLVTYTKENQNQLPNEEYLVFLRFLLSFLCDRATKAFPEFCDMLFTNGYLKMLPQAQIARQDITVRKVSTLVLGEILKILAQKHLVVANDTDGNGEKYEKIIHTGLLELQYGIERPQDLGQQLVQCKPYSLLIYIYFYCQSSENPQEATASLLPCLIEHILRLPKGFDPPKYIVKALWLVFAMSSVSNGSLRTLDERLYLEKATDRFVGMLQPNPSVYYTHNPAILLWAFTSARITSTVREHVLSQWLEVEDCVPSELATQPLVWELLLNILTESRNKNVLHNAVTTLNSCIEDGDSEDKQKFASLLWFMLPSVLSKVLIDSDTTETNMCFLLELATEAIPPQVDETVYVKIAVLLSTIFSKTNLEQTSDKSYHYSYSCLKLSLYLLSFSYNQNDNRVLMTYVNRPGFLPNVLKAADSVDDRVACTALQLLTYSVHYFTRSNFQPKTVVTVETTFILKSLRDDSSNERGAALLQLVYIILNSGTCTPLSLSYNLPDMPTSSQQYTALRALMFRVQMLCCKESTTQSSSGWKTLSSIFKYAIVSKNDTQLVAILTTQPWTHILIHFQLTQTITEEFLTFVNNWLTLLKITIKKSQKPDKKNQTYIFKQSMIHKTFVLLRKHLVFDEKDPLKEVKRKILVTVSETVEESGVNLSQFFCNSIV